MPQCWWGLTSLCFLVAPAQCLGGQYHHWQQGGADTEPVSVTAAMLGVLEKHSAPGICRASGTQQWKEEAT